MKDVPLLLEQLYKQEYPRVLAVLTRLFGANNLQRAEDAAQETFLRALRHWQAHGVPEQPSAWLIQTAKNKAVDVLRGLRTEQRLEGDLAVYLESEWTLGATVEHEFDEKRVKDDQLRMIFLCSDDAIKAENRLPLMLQVLCGFSLEAVSRALLLPVETVKKRLQRTRRQLRHHHFQVPSGADLPPRLDSLHTVLYLLFNEGYSSSGKESAVQHSLCHEALGLLNLLAEEPVAINQDTLALLAWMHLNLARLPARLDSQARLIPLDLQDRQLWRKDNIEFGAAILRNSTRAPTGINPRFRLEAEIALIHSSAPSFADTNWRSIKILYEQLLEQYPSPLALLNLAIAETYAGDATSGLAKVQALKLDPVLGRTHMPDATLAHIYAKTGERGLAFQHARAATTLGGNTHEHDLMWRQIERLLANSA